MKLSEETMAYPEDGGRAFILDAGTDYSLVSAKEDGNMALIEVRVADCNKRYYVSRVAVGLPL